MMSVFVQDVVGPTAFTRVPTGSAGDFLWLSSRYDEWTSVSRVARYKGARW